MKCIIALLTCLSFARSQISNLCPPAENIKPCTCKFGPYDKPDITCENLKSSEELINVVKKMNNYSVDSFILGRSQIGVLPSDIFSTMEIEHLIIEKSKLTKLGDSRSRPPFIGLEKSLRYIEIKGSFQDKNSPLASLSFSHLKNLESILLENNLVATIGNNWFESGPYNLKVLRIQHENISIIGSHAFEALEKLEYLTLANCSLSEITREMFPVPSEFLISIDLSYNKLKSLPSNFFTQLPSVTEIYLTNNLFATIDEMIWAPIWSQLEYVYFHGNPIICDTGMKWIYNYRLPEYYAGYCSSPTKLRNKSLRDITIADLQQ